MYAYAGNNPVGYVDPDGRDIFLVAAIVVWAFNATLLGYGITTGVCSDKGAKAYTDINSGKNIDATSMTLYSMYRNGKGQDVTLQQLGLQDKIAEIVKTDITKTENKNASIQDNFIKQICKDSKSFKRSYNFENDFFAIGSATVSGTFNGTVSETVGGKKHIEGSITFNFWDRFEDPYDLVNLIPGSLDFDGTPFNIRGTWTVDITGDY